MKLESNKPLIYRFSDLPVLTGLSRATLYRRMADMGLETFLIGRRRMITADALENFIHQCKVSNSETLR